MTHYRLATANSCRARPPDFSQAEERAGKETTMVALASKIEIGEQTETDNV